MNFLLDTHVLLWVLGDSNRLKGEWRAIITNRDNAVYVSVVFLWECVIKAGLGKLSVEPPYYDTLISGIKRTGLELLPLKPDHIRILEHLEPIHKDPFDRILISQAVSERLRLLTDDALILQYVISDLPSP